MATIGQRMTIEAFLELAEEKPYLGLRDGVVVQKAWPDVHHSVLQTALLLRLNRFAEPRHLALAFPELLTVLGGSALTPDIAVYHWARVPRDGDGRLRDDILGAPDIAAEVTSPEQGTNLTIRRCRWYVEHGVSIALSVDPQAESVLLFRQRVKPTTLRGADRIHLDVV